MSAEDSLADSVPPPPTTQPPPVSTDELPTVAFVLLAEFDINEGSVLKHQYPRSTGVDEHLVAEHMLPDGAHDRDEDWTVFYLNQIPPLTLNPPLTTLDKDGKQPLLHVLNLVRTKKDNSVRRGAIVKALAIATTYPYIQIYKPILLLALDAYMNDPTLDTLISLYNALNAMDLKNIPNLTREEMLILRSSERGDLFEEKFIDPNNQITNGHKRKESDESSSAATSLSTSLPIQGLPSRPKDTHWYETKITYQALSLPVKIPVATFPEEVGDYSIIKLIQTFTTLAPSPLHSQLHSSGAATHPIIVLLNAILTEKKVVFLGHGMSAGEVSGHVLAACALGTGCGALLGGIGERAFPYTNLTNLDNLQAVTGFVAGVCNPAFADRPSWWDVLCNVSTGTITVSSALQSATPPLPDPDPDHTKEKDYDTLFMEEMTHAISAHFGEASIRGRWVDYLGRFVRMASRYEEESGESSVGFRSVGFGEELGQGSWGDEVREPRDIGRLEGWRGTRSYLLYQKIWAERGSTKYGDFDVFHQLSRLRNGKKMSNAEAERIMITLAEMVKSDAGIVAILVHVPMYSGGLLPLSFGLFHPNESVRYATVDFLDGMGLHPVGRIFLASLNMFHKSAYARLSQERFYPS